MGFFKRIKRGAVKAKQYKERFDAWQDKQTEKAAQRAAVQTKRYNAQAKLYRAKAAANKARSQAYPQGSFGFGNEGKKKKQKGMAGLDYL